MVRILEKLEVVIITIILVKKKLERKFRKALMGSFFEKTIRKRDNQKFKLSSRNTG